MFLLIQSVTASFKSPQKIFTFHNVSINTEMFGNELSLAAALHSTMFLLIQCRGVGGSSVPVFTFHNVSINTRREANAMSKAEYLYIPQCFY